MFDWAYRRVLWQIDAQLEKALVEPLQSDYADLVAAARARIESER